MIPQRSLVCSGQVAAKGQENPSRGYGDDCERGSLMLCPYCGVSEHDPALLRRCTSGRPYQRMVAALKRDGLHICWICGWDIDMSLPYNHRMAWTLDHVQPKALYPCIGLESWNHREAHRKCNSAKGKGAPKKRTPHSREW